MFILPPRPNTSEGRIRRAGFEIEYSGVKIGRAGGLLRRLVGGRRVRVNRFRHRIEGTRFGDFKIELDISLLSEERYKDHLRNIGINIEDMTWEDNLDNLLARLFSTVVPWEIVTPPIPLDRLAILDQLVSNLRSRGARGTRYSVFYAFGVHINIEAGSLAVQDILAVLRSYFLLEAWIKRSGRIDGTRRIVPFIHDFPPAYVRLVLSPDYQPNLASFISDYIDFNATRNRPLDLLPILAHLKPDVLNRDIEHVDLVQPRPAYHFRLPNSSLSDRDWAIHQEWNRWVRVEELAYHRNSLTVLADRFLNSDALSGGESAWADTMERWLE